MPLLKLLQSASPQEASLRLLRLELLLPPLPLSASPQEASLARLVLLLLLLLAFPQEASVVPPPTPSPSLDASVCLTDSG